MQRPWRLLCWSRRRASRMGSAASSLKKQKASAY
eukprot:COSAG02_NODE_45291_length_358_cov_1.100386_1_plen_33_part_01